MNLNRIGGSQGASAADDRGNEKIKDDQKSHIAENATRDRVIAAIYETVIRPELYGAFMEAWSDHVQAALDAQEIRAGRSSDAPEALEIDPELRAHFDRAYEILEQIGRKAPPSSIADRVIGADGFAMMADHGGKVLASSDRVTRLLDGDVSIEAFKARLSANSAELFDQLMRAAQVGTAEAPPVILSTGAVPRHLMARIVPVPDDAGKPRLMVVIEALEYQWTAQAEAMLVTSFGLSHAEVDIVRNLLAGYSLRQIAELSGRSEHTVRNQAKSVLAKSGAPGQVDLIRLVVFLINQNRVDLRQPSDGIVIPRDVVRMETGLDMQIYRLGPRDGRPVLYLHGMMDGPAPLQFNYDRFLAHNIHVVMAARPGFGLSSPVARVEQGIDIMEAHIRELMSELDLVRPVLLSQMGGAIFGHTMACRLGNEVSGLVAVSGNAPITRLSQLSRMPPRQRIVAYTARFFPAIMPTVLRAGIAQIDGEEVEDFMVSLFKPGSQEHDVINRMGLSRLLHAGFRFSAEQGPAGFATDSHFVVRDWGQGMSDLKSRAICLNGSLDPVVSVDDVVAAMRGRDNVDVRVLPDAGQLLMYEKPDAVFDALEEIFALRGR